MAGGLPDGTHWVVNQVNDTPSTTITGIHLTSPRVMSKHRCFPMCSFLRLTVGRNVEKKKLVRPICEWNSLPRETVKDVNRIGGISAVPRTHLQHMKVPRRGGESDTATDTATAMLDLNSIFHLHHNSQQHQIPDALSEARG